MGTDVQNWICSVCSSAVPHALDGGLSETLIAVVVDAKEQRLSAPNNLV